MRLAHATFSGTVYEVHRRGKLGFAIVASTELPHFVFFLADQYDSEIDTLRICDSVTFKLLSPLFYDSAFCVQRLDECLENKDIEEYMNNHFPRYFDFLF